MFTSVNDTLANWDHTLSSRLNIVDQRSIMRTLAVFLTHSGDVLTFLALLAVPVVTGPPTWRSRALILMLGDLVTFITTQAQKYAIRRSRPLGEWGQQYRRIDPHSFPSGHAGRGGVMTALGLAMGPAWFGIGIGLWGLGLALSRVLTGVHYVSDALAGFLVGLMVGAVLALVLLN
jgi:undecaprenyl-diphosphatase